ncbi:MAG: Enoyl-CoA hydratase / 3-hydroxyacyl-CoA dehydrogenase / 3-hydroxybutyryl-CoA epimerase [uncultured Friedmanniella sp.]|uniref:Enoyl-CoA hydratase / 3-hydroxyacyl-CoA dehydrogenase / 3-hydroxybutyryl-CoA epimerase n=1 Tax=uncultured Friedmanniella sp. TaxID=335381 RepID=A0A6J4KUF5_9ACTN|nr:3-hydroxyacyl-CoA dehydrogenase NAD-binding domain-containing protein [uncultured Friedmanniella sp.]CAA9314561.1 MAG: Enoyl-CoA hydratase / 3-hydroxyacyl-CoA dehydrogenase / 3-hydroxybutyryl-CoA epimerase [uncultured Friedmanniella sp.]
MEGPELEQLISRAAEAAPQEVVTRALSRDVRLARAGDSTGGPTLVLITLDNGQDHTRPNTLGPRGLGELNAAIDAAVARDDVAAIALTGKPFVLAAGADLSGIAGITRREQALTIARIGHAVFGKLHTASQQTFAFVNGLALGGGLELALHCDYRTVSNAAAGIALPECFLGMFPGWGGAYLLPNLIGADRAVQVIVENALNNNRMLTGVQAHRLGIADALFDGADFLERSLDWAGRVLAGSTTVERPDVDRGEAWDAAVARGRAFADAKVAGAAPGPYRALELVAAAKTAKRTEAFAAEDEALTDLILSPELRAGLYAFDLVQKRARKPAGAPDATLARPVTKVGIVGAGSMASQLALLFLRRLEVPVVISDLDDDRVQRGLHRIRAEIDTLVGKQRLSPDQANRLRALLSGTTELADYVDCDFVLEAVFEDLTVKHQVFAELEKHVSTGCVLATNTSSLSVTAMAAELEHPERVVGFHFFNPVAVLPLLEVARAERTDDATLATALRVAKDLRKNAVLVRDTPAFVVNRLWTRLTSVLFAAVDEGTPIADADRALRPLGLPMSPMTLLQLVGPAIALHVGESLHAAFGDRFPVSPNLRALVAAGKPGVYDWTPEGTPYLAAETAALFTVGDSPSSPDEVRARALDALAEEIGLMLAEGVVEAPMDIDLCMILGAGWPFHLGGITPYLDREGVSERVLGRRFLPLGVASVATA